MKFRSGGDLFSWLDGHGVPSTRREFCALSKKISCPHGQLIYIILVLGSSILYVRDGNLMNKFRLRRSGVVF
ncbi:hypothetical protein ETJ91_15990 [Bacillus albus]|nr:hypothetical protein ETJ91_15990 [Bacillus albus]RXJ26388.1 hypothetical protein ETJ90_15745 [Bacillus albus]RXJ32032.1 hypothetical protein ETJ76_11030 [Bacillus albus]RXJ39234.1 hypothetical protein ETJ89_14870 [Bacillus albus]RXJ55749.1 hypothetical protein ETJ66_15115 [Bacillus albus]